MGDWAGLIHRALLKDRPQGKAMLKRINEINNLAEHEKEHILYAIDGLIKYAKLNDL